MIDKVLVLDNSIYVTGSIRSIVSFAKSLSNQYCFEFAMNCSGDAASYVARSGFVVHSVNFLELSKGWKSLRYPFSLIRNYRKIMNIVESSGVSIIHINDLYNQIGILIKIFLPNIPVIYHVRLLPDSYLRPIYSAFVTTLKIFADSIIYVSKAVGEKFHDCNKAILIYDALNEPIRLPAKIYLTESSSFLFLYVGNYVNGKGHNHAIEAFAIVANSSPRVMLKFVGAGVSGELDPIYMKSLKARISELNLESRVIFEGRVTDVEAAMKQADAVINLSESESFSMVCLEALTYGLPLIVSDCGGPREIVENEVCGFLVPNRNVDVAASVMLRLVEDFNLCQKLGNNGLIVASSKFSIIESSKKLSDIYDRVSFRKQSTEQF